MDFHAEIRGKKTFARTFIKVLNKNLKFYEISNFHQLPNKFSDISKHLTKNLRVLSPVKNCQLWPKIIKIGFWGVHQNGIRRRIFAQCAPLGHFLKVDEIKTYTYNAYTNNVTFNAIDTLTWLVAGSSKRKHK